jgi:pimeloyl-ACP methyl ester carboxylesterase
MADPPDLPTGTVTFLFTDVAGSTGLWERHPEPMRAALAAHDALIESLTARHGGVVVRPRGEGDSRFCVFRRAIDAAGGSAYVFGHSSGAVLARGAARVLPTKITKLALYEPPFIIDAGRPPMPADFASRLSELVAAGRRGDAVEYWQAQLGVPAEAIARMRQSPMWPGLEALAPPLPYDATIMGDTQRGDPTPLTRWAAVTVPALVMDGTVMMGREDLHTFMRHGADELATVLPDARRRTLEGQDHGPADAVLVPALKDVFLA